MLESIEKFIKKNNNGLFLLDAPTGFGKTTAVIEFIVNYLNGYYNQDDLKKIYFITNLKINLPFDRLIDKIGEEKFKQSCIVLESYADTIIKNWNNLKIDKKIVTDSDEYKELNEDIYTLRQLRKEIFQLKEENKFDEIKNKNKIAKSFERRIEKDLEPAFRKFLKTNFFFNKSVVDKKNFIRKNDWFRSLYPTSELEKFKIVFLTTAKFANPIDAFFRMPYFLYKDSMSENSVTFIDEFDATKNTLLNQIIEQGLKNQIDTLKLFLNIHYSLKELMLPKSMLKLADFTAQEIEKGDWKSPEDIILLNKQKFNEIYEKHEISLAIKSKDFDSNKAFLFNDGRSFTVFNDLSKKFLYLAKDEENNVLKLIAEKNKNLALEKFKNLVNDLNYSIQHFVKGITYLAKNYREVKNQNREKTSTEYTFEESVLSIMSIFNISDEFKDFMFQEVINFNNGLKSKHLGSDNNLNEENSFMRKGFEFNEIEDNTYHDMQSKFHAFKFNTTPEDIMIKLSENSRVIGVSATATLNTVIGNSYYENSKEDLNRITISFKESQKIYDDNNIKIHVNLVDNIEGFAFIDKAKKLAETIFSKIELKEKYFEEIEKDENPYYKFLKMKLGLVYKEVGLKNEIKSFLAFLNFHPKKKANVTDSELNEMFQDIANDSNFEFINFSIVKSEDFEYHISHSKQKLSQGERIFWISTYQTVGSGKNIQYKIPDVVIDNICLIDNERKEKDFDGIFLSTPTNMVQNLYFSSENKYNDLARYLFEQEYLYQNNKIQYYQMKNNIISGFRKIFYNDKKTIVYNNNEDMLLNNAQIIIQAVGRICRCKNKNKDIFIFAETEVVERIKMLTSELSERILNKEFTSLLSCEQKNTNHDLVQLSRINKNAFIAISKSAWRVRDNEENVIKWQNTRDYVLKNPTTDNVCDEFKPYYFGFDTKTGGYSYKKDISYNFAALKLDYVNDLYRVSDSDSDLPVLLGFDCIRKHFEKNEYALNFKSNKYIMSESFYQQVYKGAIGEVAGRVLIEEQTGYELEEIKDYSMYELFDYKFGNVYIDFKHWNNFITDQDNYVKKIERKLKRVNGDKCLIINLVKRGEHHSRQSIDGLVYQIPFLIDPDKEDTDSEMIDYIQEILDEEYKKTRLKK